MVVQNSTYSSKEKKKEKKVRWGECDEARIRHNTERTSRLMILRWGQIRKRVAILERRILVWASKRVAERCFCLFFCYFFFMYYVVL